MMFQDAIEVTVNEVVERGERVLALLDEAKLTKQTAALRREIARAVEVARKRTSAEAKRVAASGAQDLASLSLRELRELAYNLGESKSREDEACAARAWLLAAAQEKEPFDRNDRLGRAALSFADAGDWREARPRLEHVVAQRGISRTGSSSSRGVACSTRRSRREPAPRRRDAISTNISARDRRPAFGISRARSAQPDLDHR